jgi:hypothetical protein
MNMLLIRCRRRTRVAEELLEQWQIDHAQAMLACDVDELLAEAVELGQLVKRCWTTSLNRLFAEQVEDVDGERRALHFIARRTLRLFRKVAKIADQTVKGGHALVNLADFTANFQNMRQLRLDIAEKWPTTNEQLLAESQAARLRGEYLSAEDWLRDAQGTGS